VFSKEKGDIWGRDSKGLKAAKKGKRPEVQRETHREAHTDSN
jgi:hypothetical protein